MSFVYIDSYSPYSGRISFETKLSLYGEKILVAKLDFPVELKTLNKNYEILSTSYLPNNGQYFDIKMIDEKIIAIHNFYNEDFYISIYNIDGQILNSYKLKNYIKLGDNPVIKIKNNNIYVLYDTQIFIFSFNLELLRYFLIYNTSSCNFDVDKDNNIYIISRNDSPNLIIYDYNGEMKKSFQVNYQTWSIDVFMDDKLIIGGNDGNLGVIECFDINGCVIENNFSNVSYPKSNINNLYLSEDGYILIYEGGGINIYDKNLVKFTNKRIYYGQFIDKYYNQYIFDECNKQVIVKDKVGDIILSKQINIDDNLWIVDMEIDYNEGVFIMTNKDGVFYNIIKYDDNFNFIKAIYELPTMYNWNQYSRTMTFDNNNNMLYIKGNESILVYDPNLNFIKHINAPGLGSWYDIFYKDNNIYYVGENCYPSIKVIYKFKVSDLIFKEIFKSLEYKDPFSTSLIVDEENSIYFTDYSKTIVKLQLVSD